MTRQQIAGRLALAFAVLLGVGAWDCGTGSDTHPNAPQQPGPERGGPPAQQPQAGEQPNPAAGDPQPAAVTKELTKLETRIRNDPSQLAMIAIWGGERRMYFEYTLAAGAPAQHVEQNPQATTGGWWIKVITVAPGQTVGFTAGPVHSFDAKGTLHCYMWHAKGVGGLIADTHFVPQGPCAVSYTVPA